MIIFDRMFGTFEAEPDRFHSLAADATPAAPGDASELRPWDTYDQNYGLAEQTGTFNGVKMNLHGLRKLWTIARTTKSGIFARRWDSRIGSGNYLGLAVPSLKRPRYEGYAAEVAEGGGSTAQLVCRNVMAFVLGLASLALQFSVKSRSVSENIACALLGCTLVYLGGKCIDGNDKQAKQQ